MTNLTPAKGSGFPDRLRALLKERQQTAASLARGISVSPQAVGKWLKGGDIGFDVLQEVSQYLNVNWVWLRYGDDALRSLQTQPQREVGPYGEMRRKHLEDVIASEGRLRIAMSILDKGVIEENLLTGECYWSEIARAHLGVDHEMAASHECFRSLFPDSHKPLVDDFYKKAMTERQDVASLVVESRVDTISSVDILFRIFRNDAGQPIRIVGVTTALSRSMG